MRYANIALFVPHQGCPHRCIFCDQCAISGQTALVTERDVDEAVSVAERSLGQDLKNARIAFFGGSFTAIDRDYMTELLKAAYKYVKAGKIAGIRCSTRPDAIDDEILEIYKSYGGIAIELGCQSMDNDVLSLNRRGHTAEDTVKAAELIKKHGIELGVQMMTGMYGDTESGTIETAKKLIALEPATVRIYPTVVMENTRLAGLYREGKYQAQSLENAVSLCAELLLMFKEADVEVIKLGLHSSQSVEEAYVAGPYHPAFKELCESRIYLRKAQECLSKGSYIVEVPKGETSKMTGQKKSNILALSENGIYIKVRESADLDKYEIRPVKEVDWCS